MVVKQLDEATINSVARVCHESMRAYRVALGEPELPPWDEAEDWQVEATLAAIRFRIANPDAPPGAQHRQWMVQKHQLGWQFGRTRDEEIRTHPMMVPFEALPETERRKDILIQKVVDAFLAEL